MACDTYNDSRKPPTTLELTLTISGEVSTELTGAGAYVETSTFVATPQTLTLTRAAFVPRAHYSGGVVTGAPSAGDFWLFSKCCCWRCRFWYQTPDSLLNTITDLFTIPYDVVITGVGAGTSSETVDMNASAILSTVESPLFGCRDGDGLDPQRIILECPDATFGEVAGFGDVPLSWDYSDSDSVTDSGSGLAWNNLALPGPGPEDVAIDCCSDTPTAWAQIVYNGTYIDTTTFPGETLTQTVTDFTVKVEISLS